MTAISGVSYPSSGTPETQSVREKDLWANVAFKRTFSDLNQQYKGADSCLNRLVLTSYS